MYWSKSVMVLRTGLGMGLFYFISKVSNFKPFTFLSYLVILKLVSPSYVSYR